MEEGEIRTYAALLAIQAEISAKLVEVEGMKAENTYRESNGYSVSYGEDEFDSIAASILHLRDRMLAEI